MATYDSFANNWAERLSPFAKAGVTPEQLTKLKPIIQNDFAKLQRGEEPMDNVTAIATSLSIISGKPLLKEPSNPGGLRDIVGNVGKDVAGIVSFLNPFRLGPALRDEFLSVQDLIRGDLQIPDQGNPLRQLAATPGIRLIPGVWTGGNLTTPEGRQTAKEHPVSTLLDVLPLAGATLKSGAAAAASTGVVDRTAVVSKLAQQKVLTESGKAKLIPDSARLNYREAVYAAAAEGKPVGFTLAASGMKPVLDAALNPVTEWLHTNTRLSRLHSQELRAANNELNGFKSRVNDVFAKMSADERVQLGREWTQPDLYPATSPEHLLILQEGRLFQRRLGAQGVAMGELVGVNVLGKDFFYAKGSRVDKALGHQATAETALKSAIDKVDDYNHKLNNPLLTPAERLQLTSQRDQALRRLDRSKKASLAARRERNLSILETAPKEYYPMLQRRIHEDAVNQIQGRYAAGQISQQDLTAAMDRFKLGDYVPVFGKKNWDKTVSDIEKTWITLHEAGFEPVFLHNVPDYRAGGATRGRVVATHEFRPGQFKETRLTDMHPQWSDVAVGLTAGASEYVNKLGTDRFISDHIITRGLTYDEALKTAMPDIEKLVRKKGVSLIQAKDQVLNKQFAKVDNPADAFGFSSVRAHANMAGRTLYFDKATFQAAKKLTAPRVPATAFGRAAEKTNSIFKASLFTLSPRHFADELFGNTFLLATTGRFDTWRPSTMRQAWDMAKTDTMPIELSRGVDIVSTEEMFNVSMGKTAGRIFKAIRADSVQRLNEFVNKVQKSLSYLGEERYLLRQGLDPDVAKELAIRHANDALVDFDSMLPIERTLIRQVFPFYSWTRFLAKFITKYPVDHPYRAAFFSRVADLENTDEASGFPRYFRNLFFLGPQDDEGGQTAVDLRVMNPLRDSATLASLAGFVSSVSPLIDVTLRAVGVDTLAGAPEMFPELTYNPETGKLEARRLNLLSKGGVMEMLGQFIPPAASIDHFITVTDRLKRLKATDPVSYRRQLFSSLGIPFVPYQESIPKAQARQQKALTEAARAVVSRSTRKNASTRDLRRYPVVPWQGQIVSGEGLANLIDRLHSVSSQTGIPTRMLMDEVAKVMT